MRVTIIGGGVIGLCCAYYLKKEGYRVTVIDRGNITEGCSFGNMGYISPSHFIPLASPGIISQGLKWMLSSSSPFYIRPRPNRDLICWGWTFWKNSSNRKVKENTPPLFNLLMLSRRLMNEIQKDLNDDFLLIEKGCWMLYKNEKTGDHEKQLAELADKFGLRTVLCNREQVQAYEPETEVDVAGGILYLDDCHTDSAQFMKSLYTFLVTAGVVFHLNTEVKGFEKNTGKITAVITGEEKIELDELVIANGSWMPQTSRFLGIKLLMQPGKGYSIVYQNLEKNLHYPSILVDERTATTPIDRWLRIGGTMELSGHDDKILPKRVLAIYHAFRKYYPAMPLPEPDIRKAWFGYRPVTPDGMPYIGRHSLFRNLLFAGGHAMLGLSAAAGTGKLITEIIGHKPASVDLRAFNPERFS
jgi:D-amino-acid dehydrogenase